MAGIEELHASVEQLVREVILEETGKSCSDLDPGLVERLLDSEAIQSLVQRVSATHSKDDALRRFPKNLPSHIKEKMVPGHRYLYVFVRGGRAFVDHLQVREGPQDQNKTMAVHLLLGSQRFQTNPVPCICDPVFNEGFLFDLHLLSPGAREMVEGSQLLALHSPVTVVVVRQQGDTTTLLSCHTLQWRSVLAQPSASCKFTCQLMGPGSEQQVPVGLLDMDATLLPCPTTALQGEAVSRYLEEAKARAGEKRRLFITYAQQWWQEYTQAADRHASRPVRIFAMDECGKNRFVCEYVRKYKVGRVLRGPEEAARWVSVMPCTQTTQLPAGACTPWYTLPVAVTSRSLNRESKCSVLCSILLGFGLDAWVCVGTRQSGVSHLWVMTRGPYSCITFWETATGSRYLHRVGQSAAHDYQTVGCLFNHNRFLANCQASDRVEYCTFTLEEESCWKAMSSVATASTTDKAPCVLPLSPPTTDTQATNEALELQLQGLIIEHRSDRGLSTRFSEDLSYILSPALWSYEREAVWGGSGGGMDLFSAALTHTVPDGHTFKAFPLHFTHHSPRRAFSTILNSSIGREIVECRGDRTSLAVRCICVSYPEDVSIKWVLVACSYRPVGKLL